MPDEQDEQNGIRMIRRVLDAAVTLFAVVFSKPGATEVHDLRELRAKIRESVGELQRFLDGEKAHILPQLVAQCNVTHEEYMALLFLIAAVEGTNLLAPRLALMMARNLMAVFAALGMPIDEKGSLSLRILCDAIARHGSGGAGPWSLG